MRAIGAGPRKTIPMAVKAVQSPPGKQYPYM